jgi:hypothetical protein
MSKSFHIWSMTIFFLFEKKKLVTIAYAEWSFSKLKLIKSYLRSTMLQEILNGLAILLITNEMLKKNWI